MAPDPPRKRGAGDERRLDMPTFLIIGAAKSGTTSLYHYIGQHPDVFMSPVKETNFFAFCDGMPPFQDPWAVLLHQESVRDIETYRRLFSAAASFRARGEASPQYLLRPGTAERIYRYVPEAKLIAILRHPAYAAFSSFMMRLRDGHEPYRDFRQAIEAETRGERQNWSFGNYLSRFSYYEQLSEYYSVFPGEQIRVYLFEDLMTEAPELFRDLFQFIDVTPDFIPDTSVQLNRSGVIRNPVLRWLWHLSSPVRARTRPFLPDRLRRRAYNIVVREIEKPPYDPALRRQVAELYRDDIVRLQELIGRDLTAWLDHADVAEVAEARS